VNGSHLCGGDLASVPLWLDGDFGRARERVGVATVLLGCW
jgi:hypothetical protein